MLYISCPIEAQSLIPQKISDIKLNKGDRLEAVRQASQQSNAIVLLKGARTAITNPQGQVWMIPQSTPALARGGSGDVLTGFIGGLIAHLRDQIDLPEQTFNTKFLNSSYR